MLNLFLRLVKFHWMLRYLLLRIIFSLLAPENYLLATCSREFFFLFNLFSRTVFLWFLFYSIWTYAILIMYLFNWKSFVFSNSWFKFVKSCISLCNAANSDCILKRLVYFSSWFVYKYTHLLATQWTRNFVHYSNILFIVLRASAYICKQTTSIYIFVMLFQTGGQKNSDYDRMFLRKFVSICQRTIHNYIFQFHRIAHDLVLYQLGASVNQAISYDIDQVLQNTRNTTPVIFMLPTESMLRDGRVAKVIGV